MYRRQGIQVSLRPLNTVDQNYQAGGAVISSSRFSVQSNSGGAPLLFNVSMKQGGLEIQPVNQAAVQFANQNRNAVVGGAVLEAVRNMGVTPQNVRTIFLDLRR